MDKKHENYKDEKDEIYIDEKDEKDEFLRQKKRTKKIEWGLV